MAKRKVFKRANHQGSVYERKKDGVGTGIWIAAVTLDPKHRRTRTAHSRTEAERYLKQLIEELRHGGLTVAGDMQLGGYLQDWMENVKRRQVSAHTYANMQSRIRHISREIGTIRLCDLKMLHIERCYSRLPLGPNSVSHIHVHLKEALEYAVDSDLIAKNPAKNIRAPTWEKIERPVLSGEQLFALLSAMESDGLYLFPLLLIIALTGLRHGEARALYWEDIDWEKSRLSVRHSIRRQPGEGEIVGPVKTRSSVRWVKLTAHAITALKLQRQRQNICCLKATAWHDPKRQLIFTTEEGKIIHPQRTLETLHRYLDRLGLPRIRVHDLRHGVATVLAQSGAQPNSIRQQLGHSSVKITFDLYAHVMDSMREDAGQVMEDAIYGA